MSTEATPTPLPDVIAAITSDPAAAGFTARAEGQLREGVRCEATVRTHDLVVDEHCPVLDIVGQTEPVDREVTISAT